MTGVISSRSKKLEVLWRAVTLVFAAAALLSVLPLVMPRAAAQSTGPHVTGIDPSSGKVNDSVTVTGTNLGKTAVAGVFLSDDTTDFKATIVEQENEKLVFKVPQVKVGAYNLSVQVGTQILILPTHFKVEQ